jgi:hypothetical protein
MMRIHSSHILHSQPTVPLYKLYNHTRLSEQDTIDISYLFLTPGIHCITVPSIVQGRAFMQQYLSTLNCYQNIAYLGTVPLSEDSMDSNLYTELTEFIENNKTADLREFMCLYMYYDFLWIEKTVDLMAMSWLCDFEQGIYELEFDRSMPIIVLSYQES